MASNRKHFKRSSIWIISAIILAAGTAVGLGQTPSSAKSDMPASSHVMQESRQSNSDASIAVPQDFQMPEQGDIVAAVDVARDPADVPPAIGDRPPQIV